MTNYNKSSTLMNHQLDCFYDFSSRLARSKITVIMTRVIILNLQQYHSLKIIKRSKNDEMWMSDFPMPPFIALALQLWTIDPERGILWAINRNPPLIQLTPPTECALLCHRLFKLLLASPLPTPPTGFIFQSTWSRDLITSQRMEIF